MEVQEHCGTPAVDTVIREMEWNRADAVVVCSRGSLAAHVVAGSEFWKMVTSYVSLRKNYLDSNVDTLQGANNKVLNDQKHEIMAGEKTAVV